MGPYTRTHVLRFSRKFFGRAHLLVKILEKDRPVGPLLLVLPMTIVHGTPINTRLTSSDSVDLTERRDTPHDTIDHRDRETPTHTHGVSHSTQLKGKQLNTSRCYSSISGQNQLLFPRPLAELSRSKPPRHNQQTSLIPDYDGGRSVELRRAQLESKRG